MLGAKDVACVHLNFTCCAPNMPKLSSPGSFGVGLASDVTVGVPGTNAGGGDDGGEVEGGEVGISVVILLPPEKTAVLPTASFAVNLLPEFALCGRVKL